MSQSCKSRSSFQKKEELRTCTKINSIPSETYDGLSSFSSFPKPVLLEIDHLRSKIVEVKFNMLQGVFNRNANIIKIKAGIVCCNFFEHEIEVEEGAVPHREKARRMIPHKSEACQAEIEMLLDYDMIEPSKLPWACGVAKANKKTGHL